MITPVITTRTAIINCAAAAGQTLPEKAVAVLAAEFQDQNAVNGAPLAATALTVVAAAPQAGQVEFTGTASAPSNALTLSGAATANTVLFVRYVPQGAVPAAA